VDFQKRKSKKKKGKPERENLKGKPMGLWLGDVAVDSGANRFPDTSMSWPVGFMVGVWVLGDVWCGNRPSFWNQHPSSLETGLVICGIETTRSAYPSSWPSGAQSFCW